MKEKLAKSSIRLMNYRGFFPFKREMIMKFRKISIKKRN